MSKSTIPCPRCDGTGKALEPVLTGRELKVLRKKAGLSLHEVARRLDISAVYLFNLERGKRRWRLDLAESYRKACLP